MLRYGGSVRPAVTAVAVDGTDGTKMRLTMDAAIPDGTQDATLAWAPPRAGVPVRDLAGNAPERFDTSANWKDVSVTPDTAAPTLTQATVHGRALTLTFSEPLDEASRPAAGQFTATVTRDGDAVAGHTVSEVAVAGSRVAEQVLDAVESRMRAARAPGVEVSLAGERIGAGADSGDAQDRQEAQRLADWLKGGTPGSWGASPGLRAGGAGGGDGERRSRAVTPRELLTGSTFAMTAETADSDLVSLWGRAAVGRFDGREGDLSLDGEVVTGLLGADWSRGSGAGSWTAGLVVSHGTGRGGWSGARAAPDGAPGISGEVEATLTEVFPWARLGLTDRLEAWGAAGYGAGELTVTPNEPGTDEKGAAIRTDLDLWMAALGLRGTLVDGGGDGLTLTGKTDAMAVQTCAWAWMRRDPGYRAAWAAEAGPLRFEAAPFPLRVQTRADLSAADWGLAVWEDPDDETWRTPFLPGMPVLVAEPDPDPWPDPMPLLGLLGAAGARLEGLRLLNRRFVLKAELGDAALQILVPSGRAFGPGDGIVAKLGLSLPLEAPVGRVVDLWRVAGRPPPPRAGRVRDGKIARWCRYWTGSGRRSRTAGWPNASGARPGWPRSGVPRAGCAPRSGAGSRRPGRLQAAAGATSSPATCRSRGGLRRPGARTRRGPPPGRMTAGSGKSRCGIRRPALPSLALFLKRSRDPGGCGGHAGSGVDLNQLAI